jgi:hypothetical protein
MDRCVVWPRGVPPLHGATGGQSPVEHLFLRALRFVAECPMNALVLVNTRMRIFLQKV